MNLGQTHIFTIDAFVTEPSGDFEFGIFQPLGYTVRSITFTVFKIVHTYIPILKGKLSQITSVHRVFFRLEICMYERTSNH